MTHRALPTLLDIRSEHPEGAYAARVLRKCARAFAPAVGGGELSILLVDDKAIRRLNREWRGKDKATDVLSFEQDRRSGLLGDVVISLETARRQAHEGRRPLSDELARLLAHGMLHLTGHDHIEPADARKMAAAEVKLLGTVGLVGEALAHPSELSFHRDNRRTTQSKRATARRGEGR